MLELEGPWAALPDRLELAFAGQRRGTRADWDDGDGPDGAAYLVDRGVAVIALEGVLTKGGSYYGTSANYARRLVSRAARDPEVSAILLKIDSPGGSTRGIAELAEAVAAAAAAKPCYAFIEDLGASAAYFVASQARKVFANRAAIAGGMGAYAVVVDYSAMAEQNGIKVHVVKSGEHKGDGVPGTPVTEEMLAETQRLIDDVHDQFVRAVAKGRGLSLAKTRELADGRVHTAPEAQALGLIDEVADFDTVLNSLAAKKPKSPSQTKLKGVRAMSEEILVTEPTPAAPRAATFQELKTELVGADAGFLVAQLEANATLDQARKAWMGELAGRAQRAEEAQRAAEAAKQKPGVEALATGSVSAETEAGGDAIATFNALVDAELKTMGHRADQTPGSLVKPTARGKATVRAAEKNPEAYEAYLVAYNERYRKHFGSRKPAPLGK